MAAFWQAVALVLGAFLAMASVGLAANMPGAPIEADMNDPGLKNALQLAVVEHNRRSNDLYLTKVSRVIKAQKQVVAGLMYIFDVEMVRTECKKNDVKPVCDVHQDPEIAKPYSCNFHVWSRPWLNLIEVKKNECQY